VVDQHLQDLDLLERLAEMHHSFHIAETVEDRGPFVFVQRIDLGAVFDEESADFRIGVHVGGVEGEMMK
jgi:hypothetical protein